MSNEQIDKISKAIGEILGLVLLNMVVEPIGLLFALEKLFNVDGSITWTHWIAANILLYLWKAQKPKRT